MTILQIAVLFNKPEIVKHILSLKLTTTKLQLEKPMQNRPKVTARSIARKIKNRDNRNKMLEILKVDQLKHEMSNISTTLKNDMEFCVKEAVIANNLAMMEYALLLGNYGDKTDDSIVMYAVNNKNSIMIEVLAMEGYAIPTFIDSVFTGTDKEVEVVDYILKKMDGSSRLPFPKRYDGWSSWFSDFMNYQCF